ncbi:MAG TPA: hypothetical protein VNG12_05120, partial [Acidimicrobiales bacterium]|nr:hypothetical protein [Acidimicrobiales bacterium]
TGRFAGYAFVTASEGVSRLAIASLLVFAGVHIAGPYGLAIGLAPLIAALCGLVPARRVLSPGTPSPPSGLQSALSHLLGASLLNQCLLMASPLVVKVLGHRGDPATGRFLAAMVLVRVPLFLFNAILAALLPHLTTMSTQGRYEEFRSATLRLATGVLAVSVILTLTAAFAGPEILALLFGQAYRLGAGDLAILAAGSGAYMLALTLGQANVAKSAHHRATMGWAIGTAGFVAMLGATADLAVLRRVELAFCAGCVSAAIAMGMLLRPLLTPRQHFNVPVPHTPGWEA